MSRTHATGGQAREASNLGRVYWPVNRILPPVPTGGRRQSWRRATAAEPGKRRRAAGPVATEPGKRPRALAPEPWKPTLSVGKSGLPAGQPRFTTGSSNLSSNFSYPRTPFDLYTSAYPHSPSSAHPYDASSDSSSTFNYSYGPPPPPLILPPPPYQYTLQYPTIVVPPQSTLTAPALFDSSYHPFTTLQC